METLNQISDWIVRLADYPLGWLLDLPRDLAIFIVAVGTSFILTIVRKWTTDQNRLRRCREDSARLKQLKREAKRAKDKAALKRIQTTIGMIGMIKMKAEGLPLLVSIVPIAVLAIWALARLDYYPPKPGEPLPVRAYYPKSSVSKLTVLVPPKGAKIEGEAAQFVRISADEMNGEADWTVVPSEATRSLSLLIRHQGQTVEHPVAVGTRIYDPPVVFHSGAPIDVTEVQLEQAKFLKGFMGFPGVPGIDIIMFPPWLVAYLIIVIPFVPLLRRALRIY